MIRFVEGVGIMGGLGWMTGPNGGSDAGLFSAMLGDAAGSSRGASQFSGRSRADEPGPLEQEMLGDGIESVAGGTPPLERNERNTGRTDRMEVDPAASRDRSQTDRVARGEGGSQQQATSDEAPNRSHRKNNSPDNGTSREASSSSERHGATDGTVRAKADGQTLATESPAGASIGLANGSQGGSSIRLIAQPGGELGISLSNANNSATATQTRQGTAATQGKADAEAVLRAASRGINSALAQRGGTITIRLIPETLGAIRMQVEVDAGRVSVRIEATNTQAAELLSANAASLRQSLESRGMLVERIQITMPTADTNRVQTAQDPGDADTDHQDQQGHHHRNSGEHPSGDHDRDLPNDASERAERHQFRSSPVERFGERLRLILDGVGS